MSFDALAWAAKAKGLRPAEKLVLIGLAECAHRQTNECFPSLAALVEFSGLDRKTVVSALSRLVDLRLIEPTGERAGRTRQIVVYRLALETIPKVERSQKRNSSDFPSKASQKRDTEPLREPLTSPEAAPPEKARARRRDRFPPPAGVSPEQWRSFCQQRRKALNDRAYKMLCDKLADLASAGQEPGKMVDAAIERGWETFWPPREERGASGWLDTRSRLVLRRAPPSDDRELAERLIAEAKALEARAAENERFGRFDDAAVRDAAAKRRQAAALMKDERSAA